MITLPLTLMLLTVSAAPDYQKSADDAKWEWRDDHATVLHSMMNYNGPCQVEIVKKPNVFGNITLRFSKDGKELLAIEGHAGTVFVVKDDIVYYADYHGSSSGCILIAYDLANGKQLWKTSLKGLGPIKHFKYHNSVSLDMVQGAVRLLGNESSGKYIEFVNMKTGMTEGNRIFRGQ